MPEPIPVPVGILRQPRGPQGSSRGFPDTSPRFQSLRDSGEGATQGARAALRERYLRVLAVSRGLRVRFLFLSGLEASGVLGAVDLESAAFQVDELGTPLGVQEAALLRGGDLLSFSFLLARGAGTDKWHPSDTLTAA